MKMPRPTPPFHSPAEAEFFPAVICDEGLELAIWTLGPGSPPAFSVRLARTYSADAETKYSNLFTRDELKRLSPLLAAAEAWMNEQQPTHSGE